MSKPAQHPATEPHCSPFVSVYLFAWRDLWRNRGTLFVLSLSLLFLLISATTSALEFRRHLDRHAELLKSEREQWLSLGPTDPHVAAHFGIFVFRPPAVLEWFDPGVDAYAGTWEHLEAHRAGFLRDRPARDALPSERLTTFAIAPVLQNWISLLLFLLAGGQVAHEIESGRLALSLAQGLSLRQWLGARTLLILTLAAGFVILPAVVGVFVAGVDTVDTGSSDAVARVGVLVVAHSLYLAVVGLLGAAVAVATGRTAIVVGFACMFWVWDCLAAPAVLSVLANVAVPAPIALETWRTVENDVGDRHERSTESFENLCARLRRQYGVEKNADLPVNPIGVFWMEDEARTAAAFQKITTPVQELLQRQLAVVQWGGWLSPCRTVEQISLNLTGSSSQDVREFEQVAEAYRLDMNHRLNREKAENKSIVESKEETLPGKELWSQIPEFRWRPVAWTKSLSQVRTSLYQLLGWFGITGFVWWIAPRYRFWSDRE